MIWRGLGSPEAIDRWRAAHSLRSFAKAGRWEIIDRVVAKVRQVEAGPFQARELPFFYMHARLWLLITLARLGRDCPAQIARYKDELLSFVLEDRDAHVLMRHFASRALLACFDAGKLKLPAKEAVRVRTADRSPHRRLKKKLRNNEGFYSGRPASVPTPPFRFDYDFQKHDVDSLAQVFGQACWKVADAMAEIIHGIDPTVESMHSSRGRRSRYGSMSFEMTTRYHTYGQQLGWHALFLAAGRLLKEYPVTADWWHEDDPWGEWLGRYGLTRDDELWLSEGTDRTPLDVAKSLLERKTKGLAITGDRDKLLSLAGLGSRVGKELVVHGRWFSADNVRVYISSALVPAHKAATFARKLTREEPMIVWVPCFYEIEGDSEHVRGDKKEYTPWIVSPSGEARLDEHDPYGVSIANFRPRLAHDFATFCSLSKDDPFGRLWKDRRGRPVLSAQAWGRENHDREEGPHVGARLSCASSILRKVLSKYGNDLLILINLQRYEKGSYKQGSTWTHTVAVVRVTKVLNIEYFQGRINYLHRSRY